MARKKRVLRSERFTISLTPAEKEACELLAGGGTLSKVVRKFVRQGLGLEGPTNPVNASSPIATKVVEPGYVLAFSGQLVSEDGLHWELQRVDRFNSDVPFGGKLGEAFQRPEIYLRGFFIFQPPTKEMPQSYDELYLDANDPLPGTACPDCYPARSQPLRFVKFTADRQVEAWCDGCGRHWTLKVDVALGGLIEQQELELAEKEEEALAVPASV